MKLESWQQRRTKYQAETLAEAPDFITMSDDTPFYQRVQERAIRDILDRLEKVELAIAAPKK